MSRVYEQTGNKQRHIGRNILFGLGGAAITVALVVPNVSSEIAGAVDKPKDPVSAKPNATQPNHQQPATANQNVSPAMSKYSLDQLLKALALHESSGDPTAFNPEGGGAHGKYQFQTGTWKGEAKRFYPPALQYNNADEAPEAVQDAVQYLRYLSLFTSVDEDSFAAGIANYMPSYMRIAHINHIDSRLDYAPPTNHGLTIRHFGDQIMDIIENDKAANISLHYTEAPDFEHWNARALANLTDAGRAELLEYSGE